MDRAVASVPHHDDAPFRDGLGERRRTTDPTGVVRELLRIRADLTQVPAFEFALRERVSRLAEFRHPYFAQARAVERLVDTDATLALVSDRLDGFRLSELFTRAAARGLNLDINAAVCLIRQIVPAVARFHEACADVAHGALGPERVVLTSTGRLMVTEYVLGAALEQLHYSQDRYWRELRIAVPRSAGLPRFDHRTDVTQIGVIALSLILGRALREDEYPTRVIDVVNSAKAIAPKGGFESLPPGLRTWVLRALQLDARHSFPTVADANDELERVLADIEYPGLPASVEAFLVRYHEADFAAAMAPAAVAAREPRPIDEFPPERDLPRASRVEVPAAESALAGFAAEDTLSAHANGPAGPSASLLVMPPLPLAPPLASPADAVAPPAVSPVSPFDEARAVQPRDLFASQPAPSAGRWKMAAVLGLLLAGAAAYAPLAQKLRTPPSITPTGTLVVRTPYAGATVLLDGRPLGTTPLSVAVVAGPHTLELLSAGITKTVPLTITAGARVEQHIELPMASPPEAPAASIAPAPPAPSPMAPTPANAPAAPAADRSTPAAPAANAPVLPAPALANPAGWLTVQSPIELAVDANGRTIGSSADGALRLPVGDHDLTLRNEALGYRTTRRVAVAGGRATPVVVDVPQGLVAVNALPWADVWVDGARIGETPIGNLALSIGTHDVVLRHPDYGEQHHNVTVTTSGVARVSVDLRR